MTAEKTFSIETKDGRVTYRQGDSVPSSVAKSHNLVEKGLVNEA